MFQGILPIDGSRLPGDIIAGLTLAALAIPETMGYTKIAGVPAADVDGPRLSIMWRWTSRNGEPDTLPSYFDGRQFSDRPRQTGYRSARSPR